MPGSTSSNQTQQQNQQNNPWAPAVPSLNTELSGANAALSQSQAAAGNTPSQFVAQFSPEQLATFRSMLGYANGNPIPGQLASAGGSQLNTGTAGAEGSLSALLGGATTDPTAGNIAAATAYAQNPYIGGMVNNALQSAREQVRDVTLPAIDQTAAATGNTDSSRTGIAQGMVERALAEQGGNLYSQLAGGAYDTGIGAAESAREANLGALSSAGGLGSTLAGLGNAGLSGSVGTAGNLFGLSGAAGSGLTEADQANINNILSRYGFNVSAPFAPYQQFGGLVNPVAALGGTSSGTSSTTSTPSIFQVIGGLMSGAGNMAAGLGGQQGLYRAAFA